MTYEIAQLLDAITGIWDASDPAALQNQLRIYIWLFATGFTGTACWRAKFRWMRLTMLIINQSIQLAMMTTSFQKIVTILEVPLESLGLFLGSIMLSAWIFRFRKPRAYRDLERRRKREAAEAAARETDALSQNEVQAMSNRWLEPQIGQPATPGSVPPGQGGR